MTIVYLTVKIILMIVILNRRGSVDLRLESGGLQEPEHLGRLREDHQRRHRKLLQVPGECDALTQPHPVQLQDSRVLLTDDSQVQECHLPPDSQFRCQKRLDMDLRTSRAQFLCRVHIRCSWNLLYKYP
jgi:hypothetical protein